MKVTNRHEVMNPPASAARGAEARNLNSANVMGLGEVHRASEARPADDVPAPEDQEWEDYEEDGPMDLEDQLDRLLNKPRA